MRWLRARCAGLFLWLLLFAGVLELPAQGVSFAATATVVSSGVSVSSPAGTSNITITSVNLPASELQLGAVTGVGSHASSWRIRVYGHVANNANAKSVVIRVAGVTLDSLPITASVANEWAFDCTIQFRTAGPGAGAQPFECIGTQGPGTGTQAINQPAGVGFSVSLDPTVAQPLAVIAAVQTSAADIILDGYFAELVQ